MTIKTKILDALVIIFTNFFIIVFGIWISTIPITKSKSFYMNHFSENERAKVYVDYYYDIDPMELMEQIADITIDYYFGNAEEYQVMVDGEPLFNEYEVRHMKDVKDLYIIGQIIAVVSFFLLIACIFYLGRHFRRIRKKLIIYTISFYGILVVLVGAFMIWSYYTMLEYVEKGYTADYFTYLFINFHHLIFPNQDKFLLATSQGKYSNALYTLTTFLDSNLFMDAGIIIGVVTVSLVIIWFIIITLFYIKHPKICKKVDEIHERARNSQIAFNQAQNS